MLLLSGRPELNRFWRDWFDKHAPEAFIAFNAHAATVACVTFLAGTLELAVIGCEIESIGAEYLADRIRRANSRAAIVLYGSSAPRSNYRGDRAAAGVFWAERIEDCRQCCQHAPAELCTRLWQRNAAGNLDGRPGAR
jgi:hypothetical protein